jgi:hypothetical protein
MDIALNQLIQDIINKNDKKIIIDKFNNIKSNLNDNQLSFIKSILKDFSYDINFTHIHNNTNYNDNNTNYNDTNTNYNDTNTNYDDINIYKNDSLIEKIRKSNINNHSIKTKTIILNTIKYSSFNTFIRLCIILDFDIIKSTILDDFVSLFKNHYLCNLKIQKDREIFLNKIVFLIDNGLKLTKNILHDYLRIWKLHIYLIKRTRNRSQPIIEIVVDALYRNGYVYDIVDILIMISRHITIRDYDYSKTILVDSFYYYCGNIYYDNHKKKSILIRYSSLSDYISSVDYKNDGRLSIIKLIDSFQKSVTKKHSKKKIIINNKDDIIDCDKKNIIEHNNLKYDLDENILDKIPKDIILNFDKKDMNKIKEMKFLKFKSLYLKYLNKNKNITSKKIIINKKNIKPKDLNYELMELLD